MSCQRHLHRLVSSTAVIVVVLVASALPARGGDSAPGLSDRAQAKRLFDEGTTNYNQGHYGEAVERFRHAYKVWPDPLILFAIGQAQRLNGDCAAASESYARFIGAVEPSPAREEAERHFAALKAICPVHDATVAADRQAESRAAVAPMGTQVPLAALPPSQPDLLGRASMTTARASPLSANMSETA